MEVYFFQNISFLYLSLSPNVDLFDKFTIVYIRYHFKIEIVMFFVEINYFKKS